MPGALDSPRAPVLGERSGAATLRALSGRGGGTASTRPDPDSGLLAPGRAWFYDRPRDGVGALVILLGWFFFALSWFTAPWGAGGWYISPKIGGFHSQQACE